MKNILLTSTALVAFAGAAAAGGHTAVSFGGAASAEFNSLTGYATDAEMTASASATLDNGLTASTSFTLETTNFGSGEFGAGSVSLSSDTASLTFGTAVVGAVFAATGDKYAIGSGGADDGEVAGIAASATFGATTLVVSGEINANTAVAAVADDPATAADETVVAPAADTTIENIEVGVTTSAAGWDLGFGLAGNEYAMTVAGTAGGATVGFSMSSNSDWDVSVDYPVGAVTVSASTDEASAWEIGAAYAADGVSAGIELNPDNAWEVTAGYAADGITVAAVFASTDKSSLGATYDMGNGLTIGAGVESSATVVAVAAVGTTPAVAAAASVTTNYAFATFDLGGGAKAFAEYADGAQVEVGPSDRDIAEGTTVGVSFTF